MSLKKFESVPLKNISCRLTRKQIYNVLFDMVRTSQVAGSRVLALIAANLEDEQAEEILNDLIKSLVPVLIGKYVPQSSKSYYQALLFKAVIKMLGSGNFTVESTKQLLLGSVTSFCSSTEQYQLLC